MIDKESLAMHHHQGWGAPAIGGYLPPGFPGHSPDIGLPFDPQLAQELLKEAGYPEGSGFPTLILYLSGHRAMIIAARALQQAWAEHLGIQVEVHKVTWSELLERFIGSDFCITGWLADFPDPEK